MDEKLIKFVCLDLDGVFFQKSGSIIDVICQKFSLSPITVQDVFFNKSVSEGHYNELKMGRIEPQQYWDWLFDALGVKYKYSKTEYLEDLHSLYRVNEDAIALIDKLRIQGIGVALCSNNFQDNIEGLKVRFELDKYFDVQVYSYEVRAMKPDERVYSELITKCGVSAGEIVMFDDKQQNVDAAVSLGIEAQLYESFDGLLQELMRLGVNIL